MSWCYPHASTYSASGQSTYAPIIKRKYESLENALGPNVPWLRPPDQDAITTEGGTRPIGTQFGTYPILNNTSHDGSETLNIAVEPPVETVEQLPGETPMTAPCIERALSAHISLPDPDEDEMATTTIEPSTERVDRLRNGAPLTVPSSSARCQRTSTLESYIDNEGC
jgi:hypothetical protein